MTDMDWADEAASIARSDWVLDGDFEKVVSQALRKAKADGIREAVERIRNNGDLDRLEIADELDARASKLDPPT